MSHDHHDHHAPANYNRAFAIGVLLNLGFVIIEAGLGFFANSLALLADAGHNLGDVLGLLLAWGASIIALGKSSHRRTYGLRKSTILAALLNALILLVAIGGIAWEAILRMGSPAQVAGHTVIMVAALGVVINGVTALLFFAGRKGDLNIRGAFLHMATDALVSVGVVLAGIIIIYTQWWWIDPAVSLLIAVIILFGAWGLLKDSANLALDAVPNNIDPHAVETYLSNLTGIKGVHDLHIWAMSTTETALTAHLIKPDTSNDDELIAQIAKELHDKFDIEHVTLQWERNESAWSCLTYCDHKH